MKSKPLFHCSVFHCSVFHCSVFALFGVVFPFLLVQEKAHATDLTVKVGSSLESATVQADQLNYVWFTPKSVQLKDGQRLMRQDLSSYDRHAVRVALTPPLRAWVRQWERQHRVFSLARRYPPSPGPQTYAVAFGGSLSVQDRGRTVTSTWAGTSRGRTGAAAGAFLRWASHVTRSRR